MRPCASHRTRAFSSLAALVALAGLSGASLAGDAVNGREIAREHCSRCHVMPGMNNFGIGSTPSFKLMVTTKLTGWREKFETFYVLRPHPNFASIRELPMTRESPPVVAPFQLTLKDLDDLLAYVDQLATELRPSQ